MWFPYIDSDPIRLRLCDSLEVISCQLREATNAVCQNSRRRNCQQTITNGRDSSSGTVAENKRESRKLGRISRKTVPSVWILLQILPLSFERMASRADTNPKEKTGKGQREKSMLGKKNKQKRGTRMRRETEGENE